MDCESPYSTQLRITTEPLFYILYLAHSRRIEVAGVAQHVADSGRVPHEVGVVEDEALRDEAIAHGAAVRHEGGLEGGDVADKREAVTLAQAAQVPARRDCCKMIMTCYILVYTDR